MPRPAVQAAIIANAGVSASMEGTSPVSRDVSKQREPLLHLRFPERHASLSPSSDLTDSPLPTYRSVLLHFRIACFASLLLAVAFAFLPQTYPPVSPARLVLRNLVAGLLTYLAADSLKLRVESLEWSMPDHIFQRWTILAFPAALWAYGLACVSERELNLFVEVSPRNSLAAALSSSAGTNSRIIGRAALTGAG
jgi:hypothetical protein